MIVILEWPSPRGSGLPIAMTVVSEWSAPRAVLTVQAAMFL